MNNEIVNYCLLPYQKGQPSALNEARNLAD